jgi:hypothetical protein
MSDININWQQVRAQLAMPFPAEAVSWRVDSDPREYQGKQIARCLCYIDARDVQDRLDSVVGIEGWAFSVSVAQVGKAFVATGALTIGGISKSDCGEDETAKGAVSDCLKRCAVQWGVGRYLYAVGATFGEVEQRGKVWVITAAGLDKLRAKLPRPSKAA